jgi:aspartyl/glutamyl-tRNA(Asn/Gln) amidotransferase, C subunit/aspartyl-tRNA synthetase, bacterial type
MLRDQYCGRFAPAQLGQQVKACGWVATKRDMGGVLFIDLADKTGVLQVVFDRRNIGAESLETAAGLSNQSVIAVTGVITLRDETTRNPKIATGDIELRAEQLTVLSQAAPLPFPLENEAVREELRLQYRYLDLRRPEVQRNLRFRHKIQQAAQDFLDTQEFLYVETPMLTKSTPEGARDYLVPSRVHKGSFYALPQSPQLFKQLLMVGGLDRYYQIARCFRDEDLRADRQPEFTQVDMEMSFVEQEDVLTLLESLFKSVFCTAMGYEIAERFPRITWAEAMDRYGTDKPDIRFDLPIIDLTQQLAECSFQVFRKVIAAGGVVRAINIKGKADITRSEIEALTMDAESFGANGMAWIAVREDGEIYSILTKYLSQEEIRLVLQTTNTEAGDFLLFCADTLSVARRVLGRLRLSIADMFDLRCPNTFRFLFVTDFPLFEYSQEEGRYLASHHPFTMPCLEDLEKLETDPGAVRAQAYDVVLNGVELGSGSIRIHNSGVQEKMLRALGFSQKELEERFGFFIHAFRYGTPPHGGFAFGLDRLTMLLLGANSLRDVIAFPKSKDASCALTQAPAGVEHEHLSVLGLALEGGQTTKGPVRRTAAKTKIIDVERVAKLAHVSLTPAEKHRMEQELRDIVAFADTLAAMDTDGIPPTASAMPLSNVWREDTVVPPMESEWLLNGAPAVADGFILVPKVFE